MQNNEYFYKETINSLSNNEVIKKINNEIIQTSANGLFIVKGEYKENEINTESFIEYFKNLGFKVLMYNEPNMHKWKYTISWFKNF